MKRIILTVILSFIMVLMTVNSALSYLTPIPFASWNLDNSSGVPSTESHQGSYGLTPFNTPTLATSNIPPLLYEGATYDGSTEYHSVGNNTDFDFVNNEDWSIELWMRPNSLGSAMSIMDKGAAGVFSVNFLVQILSNSTLKFCTAGGCSASQSVTTSGTLTAGSMIHVVLTHNSSGATGTSNIYINGSLDKSQTTNSPTTSSTDMNFGRRSDAAQYYNGSLYYIAFFNKSLNSTEVTSLYSGKTQYGVVPPPVGLRYWDVYAYDLYDGSPISGVNVTFTPSCWNTTDSFGFSRMTNDTTSCSGLTGSLNSVNVSISGYESNETSYTIPENSTDNVGVFQGYVNITSVSLVVTGDTINASNGTFTVNTTGMKTYQECSGEFPCLIYLQDGTTNMTLQYSGSEEYYDKSFNVTISGLTKTTTSVTGVYDNILTIRAMNTTGGNITSFSTNVTESTSGYENYQSTTTGSTVYNLLQGLTYSIFITNTTLVDSNTSLAISNNSLTYTFVLPPPNINFTFKDEITGSVLSGQNISILLINPSGTESLNTTTGSLTINNIETGNHTLRYSLSGYETREYYFMTDENTDSNVTLFLLATNDTTEVLITVKDELNDPVSGRTLKILKYDSADNDYKIIEMHTTNIEGQANANLQLDTEYYKFQVEDTDGSILLLTSPSYIFSSTLTLFVQLSPSGTNIYPVLSLTGNISQTSNTLLQFDYNDPDGIATQACLYIYRITSTQYTLHNSSCSSSSSGTIFAGFDNSTGRTYEAVGQITKDGLVSTLDKYIVETTERLPETGTGMLLMMMVMGVISMVGFFSIAVAGLLISLVPLLFIIMGLVQLSYTIGIMVFVLGIFFAYIMGVRR